MATNPLVKQFELDADEIERQLMEALGGGLTWAASLVRW